MYSKFQLESLELENGSTLKDITIGFHTYGKLNEDKSNVIWVCHALTANSDVFDWWEGLFGKECLFNPDEHFIICANVIGSCYGSTGPASEGENGPLLDYFPLITIKDMVKAHEALRLYLEIPQIKVLIGASLGGQQALEWSISYPDATELLILLATNAQHSAYGIAFNESQRMAIYADRTYGNGTVHGGAQGLAAARSIAMISYRSYKGYVKTQSESHNDRVDGYKASSYQQYQGKKLVDRFNAYSYVTLSKAMDSHNVGRGRGVVKDALAAVKARTLVVGITTDQLFPTLEQEFIADGIPHADYFEIQSDFGHDGFLIETDQLTQLFGDFLKENYSNIRPTVFKSTIKKNKLINITSV